MPAVLTASVLIAVTGCGSGEEPAAPTGTPPAAAPSTPASLTVDGVAEKGVAPGCVVLRSAGHSYLLLQGTDPVSATGVPLGTPVRVTGEVLTGVASYCQQGTPLRVSAITKR